ncbi:MAG: hypothetical protein AB8B69_26120 [Chitinophagales bacterium]
MKTLLYISFLMWALVGCNKNTAPSKGKHEIKVACYNVENLFDTKDDAGKIDEEFMPESKKEWTQERYIKKLNGIYKVLTSMEGDGNVPAIIGLTEVENKNVLRDLVRQTSINERYGIIHHESPDVRGIDCALLYDSSIFKVLEHEALPITFDFSPDVTTRDIIYAKGQINGTDEILHVFVNHWSSRRGGLEASEIKRVTCALVLKGKLMEIFAEDENAKIVIMGDFNDETDNKSIVQTLGAKVNSKALQNKELFNTAAALDKAGKGTYNYKGNWNMLDQIIVSGNLLNDKKGLNSSSKMVIFQEDWMMYDDKKKGKVPSRTYGGPNYYGGYSDHLPVYLLLTY